MGTRGSKDSPKRAVRQLAKFADGVPKTQLEPRRSTGDTPAVPIPKEMVQKLGAKRLLFLEEYVRAGSMIEAYLATHPNAKNREHAHGNASRYFKQTVELAGGMDNLFELMGLSYGNISRTLVAGLNADIERQFITRDGQVVVAPKQDDIPSRLSAVKLIMQARGLLRDTGKVDPVTQVNIINYAPEGAPPWPSHQTKNKEIDVTPEEVDPDFPDGKPWE